MENESVEYVNDGNIIMKKEGELFLFLKDFGKYNFINNNSSFIELISGQISVIIDGGEAIDINNKFNCPNNVFIQDNENIEIRGISKNTACKIYKTN